jgi:glycosyltransferase involved in cell wall biosynthesis
MGQTLHPKREHAGLSPEVSVVLAAFNEAANLEAVVKEITSVLGTTGLSGELLIVDDGSTDTTGLIADEIAVGTPSIRVVHHERNLGLGGVYRTGFREATGARVTFFPADGQFPGSVIPQLLAEIESCDMVLGYLPFGRRPVLSTVLSLSEQLLYRLLFGRIPRFQGVLMFRRSLLEQVELKSDGKGWAVLFEFIIRVHRRGSRVRSIPTAIRPRLSGSSKVNNLRTVRDNLVQVLALRRYL